ncbi:hypothetical protein BH18ACI4_BH18ACI4_13920 [soil metagenome]
MSSEIGGMHHTLLSRRIHFERKSLTKRLSTRLTLIEMGDSGENTQNRESERRQSGESEFLGSNSVTARIESTKAQHIPEVIARQWNLPAKVTFQYAALIPYSSLGTWAFPHACCIFIIDYGFLLHQQNQGVDS